MKLTQRRIWLLILSCFPLLMICFQNFKLLPSKYLPQPNLVSGEETAVSSAFVKSNRSPASVEVSPQIVESYKYSQIQSVKRVDPKEFFGREMFGALYNSEENVKSLGVTESSDASPIHFELKPLDGQMKVQYEGYINADLLLRPDQSSVQMDMHKKLSDSAQLKVNLEPMKQSGKVQLGVDW